MRKIAIMLGLSLLCALSIVTSASAQQGRDAQFEQQILSWRA